MARSRRALGWLLAVAAAGCREPPAPTVAAQPADAGAGRQAQASGAQERAARLFHEAGARGALVMLDVADGAAVASIGVGRDVDAPVTPLSVIKIYLAALWWDQGLGDGRLAHPRAGPVTVHDMLVAGYDRPGFDMAAALRRSLGDEAMRAALARYGLGAAPGHLSLTASDDPAWGDTLSIGEKRVTVTLGQVSSFLRAIGAGGAGLVGPDTARRLQSAMLDAVDRGTAKSAAPRLAGTGWQLGGKTGTGPDVVGPTSDGWFAGLVFEDRRPRYTIAVFVEDRGPGGGVAASFAAEMAVVAAGLEVTAPSR
ncbi:MAG TPA: penicillin-binding transpeptidase domain-containing protein [Kofleriaceae bacterium]|nr:penicillin-binding transpeptidase domain-containing protein [Kofleriaceae bacterium]